MNWLFYPKWVRIKNNSSTKLRQSKRTNLIASEDDALNAEISAKSVINSPVARTRSKRAAEPGCAEQPLPKQKKVATKVAERSKTDQVSGNPPIVGTTKSLINSIKARNAANSPAKSTKKLWYKRPTC